MNKPTLLILDDEARILTSLEDLFEDNFEVMATSDSKAALRFVEDHDVAVVLSDERMPGLSGDEFLGKVKQLSNAVRLLMSGYSDIDALMRAVNNGQIYAYIAKPWNPAELNQVVLKAATHHELVRAVEYEQGLLRALMEGVPDRIFFKDSECRYTRVNRAQARLLGARQVEDCIGKQDSDFPHLEFGRLEFEEEQQILRTTEPLVEKIEEFQDAGGRHYWMSTTKVPLIASNGLVSGIAGISRDITELKRIECALRAAHDELELRVKERTAELGVANAALSREIGEHDKAKQQAEQANRAKSEFLSLMSHELRTPLNSILGFAQILEMNELSQPSREAVGYIVSGGRHLLRLIEDLLDIARIESGRFALSLEPVPPADAIQEAMDMVKILAADRGIRLFAESTLDSSSCVLADRRRLRQIILNLLSNAVKYNRPDGTVRVSSEPIPGGRLRITVQDTGAGIAPQDQSRLFEPFERLSADRSAIQGTGLGLTLSKRLADAMGGTIGLHSVPGTGSSFWVELPLVSAPEHATELASVPQPAEQKPGTHGLNILYIEDRVANIKLMERILSHRPQVSLNSELEGGLGLQTAFDSHPDLILLDLHLPDVRGDEVLQRLRADARTAGIPVVVLSAEANPREMAELRAAGAQAYLTKPVDVDDILRLVDQYLLESAVESAR